MNTFDVIIIGAGAAGLTVAARATDTGKSVCVLDMGDAPARKVRVSGGGKCNFTNTHADCNHYFGLNPDFVRGALARWTPQNTIDWVKSHGIKIYEKSPGQYFAESSQKIIDALLAAAHGAKIISNTTVKSVEKPGDTFIVSTTGGAKYSAQKLVVATGGMSYANLGVSDIGYKIAKHFGHKIVPIRPALCAIKANFFDSALSGISIPVEIKINREIIRDDMLFTHFGLGGPAIYRATARDLSNGITINLLPNADTFNWLRDNKKTNGKKQLKTILATKLPERVAEFIANGDTRNIADWRDSELCEITDKIANIKIAKPTLQTLESAEVTRGGVATDQISSKTMESKLCNGLYFIGEVLDITGDLGGYNLQWAWASAHATDI
ncbi:MAG: aminoacetone oxidase family FAD-binding enzyme [Alphaproteobacteria bacterium]|nr:aminoacetone oxidase family FAD-binding enzyme [Alphaproteobacteria bacterium]